MHIFTLCSILYISEKWTFYNFEVCAKRLGIKKKKEKYLISRNLKMGKPSKVIYKNGTFELGTKNMWVRIVALLSEPHFLLL